MSDSSSLDPELHRNHKRKRTHTDLDKNPPTDCIDMFDTLAPTPQVPLEQENDAMDVVDVGAKESPSKEDGDREEEDENPKTLIVRFLKEHTVYAYDAHVVQSSGVGCGGTFTFGVFRACGEQCVFGTNLGQKERISRGPFESFGISYRVVVFLSVSYVHTSFIHHSIIILDKHTQQQAPSPKIS